MDHKRTFDVKLVVALLLLPPLCFGGIINTPLIGTTGNVLASSTNTYNYNLPCGSSQVMAINAAFTCNGTNASTITFNFDSSVDGLNWVTNYLSWGIVAAGTTSTNYYTNLTSLGGIGFLRLANVANVNTNVASYVTNLLVNAYVKIQQ